MDVSIIIVNYNTSELLKDCLLSLIEKTEGLTYEVIIVDNASVDDSIDMLRENFPNIVLIASKENLGFGKANNLGANYAKGKYLFLLNTDTLLINNAINILFKFMENNCDIGVCGGNLYHKDGQPNYSYSLRFPSLFTIFFYRFHLTWLIPSMQENFNSTSQSKEVAIIIGADYFIRKNIYDRLGGFDPKYFMYIEDGDLSYRVKNIMNSPLFSVPDAKIVHIQGKSSNTDQKYFMEVQGYILYFNKFYSSSYVNAYLLLEIFNCFIKLSIYLVTFKIERVISTSHTFKFLTRNFFL